MNKYSKVVSVRLTEDELEWLTNQQLNDEPITSTIKRLLFGCKQPVNIDQADTLKTEILTAVHQLIEPLRDALLEDREKLERLANTVNDLVEKNFKHDETIQQIEPEFSFESMTKQQLKDILIQSGIKPKSNATHAQLVELCRTKN